MGGRVRLTDRHHSQPKELSLSDHLVTTLWEQPWFCPIDPLPIAELTETSAREYRPARVGLSPLTRSVTVILERHLLSLSNRDFAARTHAPSANEGKDLIRTQVGTAL
jgi:hypothetical protein